MSSKPDAFLSYTRFDDQRGKISEFCRELSYAVEAVSGDPFHIFQDIDGIGIGEHWPDKLDEMLSKARIFIPIVTPKFFTSGPCRSELTRFLEQERKVGRKDLVLPIYWIPCAKLEEPHLKAQDELAQVIHERQRWDWRRHRLRPITDHEFAEQIELLAIQIERARRNVQGVVETAKSAAVPAKGQTRASSSSSWAYHHDPDEIASSSVLRAEKFTNQAELWTPGEIFREIDESWCPEMVKIPAGNFLMGSPADEPERRDDEGPQHEVTISREFALGRYPVTFEEFDRFCEATGRQKPTDQRWRTKRRPVINVSHEDAEDYCAWLSEITREIYRLPTEEEWEYACRAGTTGAYSFGDTISEQQANFAFKVGKSSEVGSYPANAWGLHDMHGNVWEWCLGCWYAYEYIPTIGPGVSPIVRGGSWNDGAQHLRSACRNSFRPRDQLDNVGLRCVRVQGPAGQG